MHQLHQSEPVKSNNTNLFSIFAALCLGQVRQPLHPGVAGLAGEDLICLPVFQLLNESPCPALGITFLASQHLAMIVHQDEGWETLNLEPFLPGGVGLFYRVALWGLFGEINLDRSEVLPAYSWNSKVESVSWSNFLHQPHQSEPVKKSRMDLFSDWAFARGWSNTVSQPASPAAPA